MPPHQASNRLCQSCTPSILVTRLSTGPTLGHSACMQQQGKHTWCLNPVCFYTFEQAELSTSPLDNAWAGQGIAAPLLRLRFGAVPMPPIPVALLEGRGRGLAV